MITAPMTLSFPEGVEANAEMGMRFLNAVVRFPGGRASGYALGGGWVSETGEVSPYEGFEGSGGSISPALAALAKARGVDAADKPALLALLAEVAALVPRQVEAPGLAPGAYGPRFHEVEVAIGDETRDQIMPVILERMEGAGVSEAERADFTLAANEAADPDAFLAVCHRWVTVL